MHKDSKANNASLKIARARLAELQAEKSAFEAQLNGPNREIASYELHIMEPELCAREQAVKHYEQIARELSEIARGGRY